MSKRTKLSILLIVLACGVLFAVFVWPTWYRYDHINMGGNIFPVRIHRFTQEAEVLLLGGWRRMAEERKRTPAESLPPGDMSSINVQAFITDYGWLRGDVYNGSSWRLESTTLRITVLDAKKGPVVVRDYQFPTYLCDPLRSCEIRGGLGFRLEKGQDWYFEVLEAKGLRPEQ